MGGRGARLSLKSAQRQHFLGVDTRVVSGCAQVCLTLSGGTLCVPRGRAPAWVVFLSLGVSVCAVWCLWVCLCGLCWCVARHVYVCLISLWLAGPCSCMIYDTRGEKGDVCVFPQEWCPWEYPLCHEISV